MSKKTNLILGLAFILTSGICYTMERLSAYILWSAQVNTGSYPTIPRMPTLLDNLFIPFFLLIGLIFVVIAFKDKILLINDKT